MEKKYKDLLEWWLSLDVLTPEEKEIILKQNLDVPQEDSNYEILENNLFSKLLNPCITNENYKLELAGTASELIEKIFNYYVTDDTLVIYSNNEHDTPMKCINKCKNKLVINTDKFNINLYYNEIKKYKKVFVYIIGTEISTGKITPQIVYEQLSNTFKILDINSIIVCDDVHGMFITPRDYSIFDYVIGTAHALNKNFDMGMIISKRSNPIFGIKASNWLLTYDRILDIILKRKDKMDLFYKVMSNVFEKYIIRNEFKLISNVTPNIFSLYMKKIPISKNTYDELDKHYIRIEGFEDDSAPQYYLRIRAQQYITHPELLIEGISKLLKMLDSSIYLWDNLN